MLLLLLLINGKNLSELGSLYRGELRASSHGDLMSSVCVSKRVRGRKTECVDRVGKITFVSRL